MRSSNTILILTQPYLPFNAKRTLNKHLNLFSHRLTILVAELIPICLFMCSAEKSSYKLATQPYPHFHHISSVGNYSDGFMTLPTFYNQTQKSIVVWGIPKPVWLIYDPILRVKNFTPRKPTDVFFLSVQHFYLFIFYYPKGSNRMIDTSFAEAVSK